MATLDEVRNPVQREVLEPIAKRWSPRAFADKPVQQEKLLSLFEAARWAASSYNEQPWRFILATKGEPEAFDKVLSCLREGNQGWAKDAPVLMLTLVKKTFSNTGGENRHARHDLGQAVAHLALQAAALDLYIHQMAGILPDRAREVFEVPDEFEVVSSIALGYVGEPESLPEDLRAKEGQGRGRTRKPLSDLVFEDSFGQGADIVKDA